MKLTRIAHALMLAGGTLALAGCMVGPNFKSPDAPAEDKYTAEPLHTDAPNAQQLALGEALGRDWWQLFQSPAIDDVVKRALAGNQSLAAAASNLEQARELAAAQAGGRYPQVGLTAGIGREKYGDQFLGTSPKPPIFTYFSVGATVSYTLDYTGGITRSVEQQTALADYQRQQLRAAQLAVSGNAINQVLRIASAQAQIATVEEILKQDRENVNLVGQAFAAGAVSRVDTVSAQSQLASDSAELPPLRQELAQARTALSVLLGQPPATANLPDVTMTGITLPQRLPVSLPSELAHRRPDILAAEAQLHAATAAVGVATANLYPQITLSATGGPQSTELAHLFDAGSNAFGLAGSLLAPIFDGGTLRARRRAAEAAMQAGAANYKQTVLTAFGQVADALQALQHDAEELDAQSHAQDAARENADLTRRSYTEGNIGVLQVLDAQRVYERARLGFVRAQAQRYTDTVQLFLALGGAEPQAPAAQVADTKAAR
ncbi:MAG TPA: efflux transporter outer membrane subunit [Burkholderiales bacterium]|jgi:NodT family efflux transporter outer membrane factor (OMF) lipoprotein